MVESTPTIYGPDDGEKDDESIQEEHMEPDERDGETDDEEHILKREDLEKVEESVPNSGLEDKPVDIEPYNPYNDTRADEELTEEELAQRQGRKLYAPDGKLAALPKTIKSVKIKSIKEKAEDNDRKKDQ